MEKRWSGDPADLGDVTLDVSTITLGEATRAEMESGYTISQLVGGGVTRKLLAVYIHGLRSYAEPPKWSELSDLRLLDVSPSTSRSSPDNLSPKSNASRSETPTTSSDE